jgi:hypothetical protein
MTQSLICMLLPSGHGVATVTVTRATVAVTATAAVAAKTEAEAIMVKTEVHLWQLRHCH